MKFCYKLFILIIVFTLSTNSILVYANDRNIGDASGIPVSAEVDLGNEEKFDTSSGSLHEMSASEIEKMLQYSQLHLQIANTALQFISVLCAVISVAMVIIGFLGLKEVKNLKKIHKKIESQYKDFQIKYKEVDDNMELFFESSYFYNMGEEAYSAAHYEDAIDNFKKAFKLRPNNELFMARLARSLTNIGKDDEAINLLTPIKDSTDNDKVLYTLATSYRYKDQTLALELIKKATEINSESSDNWNYYHLILRDANRDDEALDALNKAIECKADDPIAYFYRALLEFKLHKGDPRSTISLAFIFGKQAMEKHRIKLIWFQTIEYLYMCMNKYDTEANNKLSEIKAQNYTKRNQKAIIQHFVTYWKAANIGNDEMRTKLEGFDTDVINSFCTQ